MYILWLCYEVMFSHDIRLWLKDFPILKPMRYDHVIWGDKLIKPMLQIYVKEDLKILQKWNLA